MNISYFTYELKNR